jgi:hypothetical protein
MLPTHVALVSELPTNQISTSQLLRTAAALQKQVTRDFGPVWGVNATVNAFSSLDDVPVDYWPIMVRDDIDTPGAAGVHEDDSGQPFALVQFSNSWTLTASHECLEMLGDPFGKRMIAGQSVAPNQGRVQYLVEVCDPSEGWNFAYRINNVTVSDFFTPHFFDPVKAAGVRYSYGGHITEPRQVLKGGYLSWMDPLTRIWWQKVWFKTQPEIRKLGVLSGSGSLRSQVDELTQKDVSWRTKGIASNSKLLQTASSLMDEEEASGKAKADLLRAQIEKLKKGSAAPSRARGRAA